MHRGRHRLGRSGPGRGRPGRRRPGPAFGRRPVGRRPDLGLALGRESLDVPVVASVDDALEGVDVLIEYTSHRTVRANVLAAIARRVAVVIGASGLTAADYADIDAAARANGVGVIAAGNFSITAAMAQAAALLVARHLPDAEVIDYASAGKLDAPSGTSRELAERLAALRPLTGTADQATTEDPLPARGLDVDGIRVHSLRLPSFSVSTEVVFGLPDERLSIRHDAGSSAVPYVSGTLLAVRLVRGRVGLTRGLDTLLLS